MEEKIKEQKRVCSSMEYERGKVGLGMYKWWRIEIREEEEEEG